MPRGIQAFLPFTAELRDKVVWIFVMELHLLKEHDVFFPVHISDKNELGELSDSSLYVT